jgi:hypothetical protein
MEHMWLAVRPAAAGKRVDADMAKMERSEFGGEFHGRSGEGEIECHFHVVFPGNDMISVCYAHLLRNASSLRQLRHPLLGHLH